MKKLFLLAAGLILALSVTAQEEQPSAEEIAKANNPLADMVALNVQYYFRPQLNEVTGGSAHTTWLRFALPTGRVLWRLSAPLETRHVNNSTTNFSKSGFGDLDIFAAYLAVMKPKVTFGIGPSASFNTASSSALGTGKNTLGVAAVGFFVPVPQIQLGALVIWRTDLGGDASREDVNLLAIQPIYFWQVGKGFYFRGAPIIPVDLDSGDFHLPLGMGLGKVVKIGGTVFNFFIEPQPSILVEGAGQPTHQIYGSLNMQF